MILKDCATRRKKQALRRRIEEKVRLGRERMFATGIEGNLKMQSSKTALKSLPEWRIMENSYSLVLDKLVCKDHHALAEHNTSAAILHQFFPGFSKSALKKLWVLPSFSFFPMFFAIFHPIFLRTTIVGDA
jgi:hypothetical protein